MSVNMDGTVNSNATVSSISVLKTSGIHYCLLLSWQKSECLWNLKQNLSLIMHLVEYRKFSSRSIKHIAGIVASFVLYHVRYEKTNDTDLYC